MAQICLALDCVSPTKLAEFWKLALGYEDEPPPPPFKTREEWAASFDNSDDDQEDGAWLHDPDGRGPRMFLQETHEPRAGMKNRIHIDVRITNREDPQDQRWARITAKAAELTAAGGSIVREFDGHHIWMHDPEGNDFCVC
jgi:hypothetical protein